MNISSLNNTDTAFNHLSEKLRQAPCPPAKFCLNRIDSDSLVWNKTEEAPITHIDYPMDHPVKRITQKATFSTENLSVEVTFTEYPNYPIIEYEAYIENTSKTISGRITDMRAIDCVLKNENNFLMHYYTGATHDWIGQYTPCTKAINKNISLYLEETCGKSSCNYMPYFNAEGKSGGVIFALGWQGNWKCFFQNNDGLRITAGQRDTDLILFPGEKLRFPQITILFYSGSEDDGQNLWRRFMLEHVTLRMQGHRMKSNALVCVGDSFEGMMGNAKSDLQWIDMLQKTGLNKLIDYFTQDAGWYDCGETGWEQTGNWRPDSKRYPNGIRPVSDAVRKIGMKYSLWLEPERARCGTDIVRELSPDGVMALDWQGFPVDEKLKTNDNALVYYGNEKALDYVSETIKKIITEEGIDQYRQDFNFFPDKYYQAIDNRESVKYGIPRIGIAENKHTTGIFKMWDKLLEAKPDLDIDVCASGGMRHDIKTQCYSFTHTVTDYWTNPDEAQCFAYTKSKWWPMSGGGAVLDESTDYDLNSRLVSSFGVAVNNVETTKEILKKWRENSDYLLYDYYPLLPFTRAEDGIMALQYHNSENNSGSVFVYLRAGGKTNIKLKGLKKGKYSFRNITDSTETVLTDEQLKQGLEISSADRKAIVLRYGIINDD